MSNNIDRIKGELEGLGYETRLSDSSKGTVVCFEYKVESGSHIGESVTVGISMHGSESYPEYPPHWIHITPPVDDGKGGAIEQYQDTNGLEWIVLSRPPGELWDRLPTKHMHAYLSEHMRRFWNEV